MASAASSSFVMALFRRHLHKQIQQGLYKGTALWELADKTPIPRHAGQTVFVPKHIPRNTVAALTEYTLLTPSGTSAAYYSATVAGYAAAKWYSDFLVASKEVPGQIASDIFSNSKFMGYKYDDLLWNQISGAGTFVSPDGGVTATGSVLDTNPLTLRFFFDGAATLRKKDAPLYDDGFYYGLISPQGEHDALINASGAGIIDTVRGRTHTPIMQQASPTGASKIENMTLGILAGVRIMTATRTCKLMTATGGLSAANSGYPAYILSPGWGAAADMDGMRPRVFIKRFGEAGVYDPVDQLMSVGIKGYFATVPMDTTNRLVRTISGARTF